VSTIEELHGRKSSGCGMENENTAIGIGHAGGTEEYHEKTQYSGFLARCSNVGLLKIRPNALQVEPACPEQ
jgi:hypothetical protein